MTTALVLRHVAFEDLGSLEPILLAHGMTLRWVDAGVDDLAAVDPVAAALLIVLGGPIGACETDRYPWLERQLLWLRERLLAERPVLGFCLGAQLMAAALGARVYAGRVKEIGWWPLKLTVEGRLSALSALDGSLTSMFHWHGDTFDLPIGATLLASSKQYRHQAFAWGPSALALRCHPELDPARLESWLIGHAVELALIQADLGALRAQTASFGPTLVRQATSTFTAWLATQLPRLADLGA